MFVIEAPPPNPPADPLLARVGRLVAGLSWRALSPEVRARLPLLLLDVFGCACAGRALGAHAGFADAQTRAGGPEEAVVWGRRGQVPAAQAALINGCVAHHVDMDDGHAGASLHGGVTVIPAALAVAERADARGEDLLAAVAAGYTAAIACGRPLRDGIVEHRLHPPSIVGGFGAAAASARVLGLDAHGTAGAMALAGTLAPLGPFEAFTQGAPVKDLYAGWPAAIGVLAATFAGQGLGGRSTSWRRHTMGSAASCCMVRRPRPPTPIWTSCSTSSSSPTPRAGRSSPP